VRRWSWGDGTVHSISRADRPYPDAAGPRAGHRIGLLGPDRGLSRRRAGEELIVGSTQPGRRADLLIGVFWHAVDLLLAGDRRAPRVLTELRELLATGDHATVRCAAEAIEVMFDIRAGRLEHAQRRAAECGAVSAAVVAVTAGAHGAGGPDGLGSRPASQAPVPDPIGWYEAQLAAIRWYQGRIGELVPTLGARVRAGDATKGSVRYAYLSALATAAAAVGDRGQAAAALAVLRAGGLARLTRTGNWVLTMYGITEAAYALGDAATAAEAYDLLSPYAALPMTAGVGIVCYGSTRHALGLARLTLGDPDGAIGHLRAAVRDNLALGHWPAVALARHRLAAALARASDAEAWALAGREAAAARREALQLGMILPPVPVTLGPPRAAVLGPAAFGPDGMDQASSAGSTRSADAAGSTGSGDSATSAHPAPARPAWPGPADGQPGAHTPSAPVCRRDDNRWYLEFEGRHAVVEHCRGLAYLAVLLENPGREISAVDLAAGPAAPGTPPAATALDARTVAAYRRRLDALQQTLDRCDALGDRSGAIRAHAQRERLLARMRDAVGAAGRDRPAVEADERARIAVGKAIRRALARVRAADPLLGELLSATVRTGRRCAYLPLAPAAVRALHKAAGAATQQGPTQTARRG